MLAVAGGPGRGGLSRRQRGRGGAGRVRGGRARLRNARRRLRRAQGVEAQDPLDLRGHRLVHLGCGGVVVARLARRRAGTAKSASRRRTAPGRPCPTRAATSRSRTACPTVSPSCRRLEVDLRDGGPGRTESLRELRGRQEVAVVGRTSDRRPPGPLPPARRDRGLEGDGRAGAWSSPARARPGWPRGERCPDGRAASRARPRRRGRSTSWPWPRPGQRDDQRPGASAEDARRQGACADCRCAVPPSPERAPQVPPPGGKANALRTGACSGRSPVRPWKGRPRASAEAHASAARPLARRQAVSPS